MSDTTTNTDQGRKVFFLYPHSVLSEDLLVEILSNEFEIYTIHDRDAAARAAKKWPGSIVFVNIDEEQQGLKWEAWIRRIMKAPETAATRVGIVTYNPNADLARKYLMDIGIPCGFIQLKLGVVEGKRIILKTLEANEARGRRRYVRARCSERQNATFSMGYQDGFLTGTILDISVAGMAFSFDKTVAIKQYTSIADVQLRLKGTLCRLSGKFVGPISGYTDRSLMLFDAPLRDDAREKIHRFIFHALQEELDAFVKNQAD